MHGGQRKITAAIFGAEIASYTFGLKTNNRFPVVAPPEIAEKINSPYVMPGEYGHEAVLEISEENFESIFESQISGMGPALVASGGLDFAIRAFPFCSAYFRGKITRDQFTKVIGRLTRKSSKTGGQRSLTGARIFQPVRSHTTRLFEATRIGPCLLWLPLCNGIWTRLYH
jgi:hypothetical protein